MPELPEVETMCRGLSRLRGAVIRAVVFPKSRRLRSVVCRPAAAVVTRSLPTRRLETIARRGKRLVLGMSAASGGDAASKDRQLFLVIEPRMTGLVLVAPPPTLEHVRMTIAFDSMGSPGESMGLSFWDRRGLGTISLVDACGLERVSGPDRLGPDALEISGAVLCERLGRSSRAIKVALLDQRAIAGIGNLYASEILFHAGIHPAVSCRRLAGEQWSRLAAATREVLEEAVAMEGSTLGDATYRTAENLAGRYQQRHVVYARKGLPCPRCQTPVRRIVQAQRSTFFCPGCQVAKRGRRG